jgi:hypothetical protein
MDRTTKSMEGKRERATQGGACSALLCKIKAGAHRCDCVALGRTYHIAKSSVYLTFG